ncbi:MAG: site-specific DNA-methyltransferase [Microbacteriaceae bacterium]|nr:site-specific DNA-methyltransferase [Microbacteriaceae bacterium]
MSGRLTLTWANKDQALVSTIDGGYQWVDPADPRAAEIRLLDPVSTHGETAGDNLLIRGDGLHAMRSLARIPEYAGRYRGKVKLVYIDPPFNTGQAFEHYDDSFEHSVWLGMMRERLVAIRDLLAPDGSVWVHLDYTEVHYAKVLMDEVFGRANFIGDVVWQKVHARDNRTDLSISHDTVLVYAADRVGWRFVRNLLDRTEDQAAAYANPDDDPRGPWTSSDMSGKAGPGRRKEQFYTVVSPAGVSFDPAAGRCWIYTQDRYEEVLADGRIWFGANGKAMPRVKRFLAEVQGGVVPDTWWTYEQVGNNQDAKREIKAMFEGEDTPFATPKPERLIERVIHIGSNPGDIVLDAFAGSGTTAAVAHKMRRRWVTIEQQASTVDAFTRPRLVKVVDGADPGGITESAGWTGGGGFTELRVAPPTFAEAPAEYGGGPVVVANLPEGQLPRAVAAALEFELEERGPFIGRKGRTRLAVVEGLLDDTVVDDLTSALAEGESVQVAAISFLPEARERLQQRVHGASVRRIPDDLFRRSTVTR